MAKSGFCAIFSSYMWCFIPMRTALCQPWHIGVQALKCIFISGWCDASKKKKKKDWLKWFCATCGLIPIQTSVLGHFWHNRDPITEKSCFSFTIRVETSESIQWTYFLICPVSYMYTVPKHTHTHTHTHKDSQKIKIKLLCVMWASCHYNPPTCLAAHSSGIWCHWIKHYCNLCGLQWWTVVLTYEG